MAHNNIGATYLELEDWPAALPFLKKAREIILNVAREHGWDPRLYIFAAQLQANLSQCYVGLEDYPQALEEALTGLPDTKTGERPDHFKYHEIYLALAEAYAINGQPEEAESYFQLLEKIYLEFFGAQSAYMATLYQKKADNARRQGLIAAALELNTNALAANGLEAVPGKLSIARDPSHIRCQTCEPGLYAQRTSLLWALSNTTPARQDYLQACLLTTDLALESLRGLRQTILFRESSRQALFAQFRSTLKTGSLAAQNLYQITGQPAYLERAFELTEKGKANILLEALVLARADAYSGLPEVILSEERRLGLELVRQEKLLEDALEERDSLRAEEIRNNGLFVAKRNYEVFLQQLKADHPRYFAARHEAQVVTLPGLQKSLGPNDLFLSYSLSKENNTLQIFAITKDSAGLTKTPWQPEYSSQTEQY